MLPPNPIQSLSNTARRQIVEETRSQKVIDDSFTSTFTPFSAGDAAGADEVGTPTGDEGLGAMRREIARALDRLEAVVAKVLADRAVAEQAASKWIAIGGGVILLMIVAAVLTPLVAEGQVLPSIFSSISAGGLLLLVYSPVRERLAIANDRANLTLMVHGFRIRFATAETAAEFRELGQELAEAFAFRQPAAN